jgi:hypothetical protein
MALSSGSKKSTQSDSDSESDDEVRDELPFLRQENERLVSYGPPWAHYLGWYQDRLLGGPLGLPGLRYTAPDGVEHKDYRGEVLG